jgi:hypothetical protein
MNRTNSDALVLERKTSWLVLGSCSSFFFFHFGHLQPLRKSAPLRREERLVWITKASICSISRQKHHSITAIAALQGGLVWITKASICSISRQKHHSITAIAALQGLKGKSYKSQRTAPRL